MDGSGLQFITCQELRDQFDKCRDDIQKRILIIDVRDAASYERSKLCLDARLNAVSAIKTKYRVMNIDPDRITTCTAKNFMNSLALEDDQRVFNNRRDATEVVIIDSNTDDVNQMASPKSKVMRVINGLTKFDTQTDRKIKAPILILKGGFRDWITKYAHFTTDPSCDPDDQFARTPSSKSPAVSPLQPVAPSEAASPIRLPLSENGLAGKNNISNAPVNKPTPPRTNSGLPGKPPSINKPVPTPPQPINITNRPEPIVPPKPPTMKNAPGTAVPISANPLMLRSPLPRSQSSPNVNQADGDELEISNQLDRMDMNKENHSNLAPIITSNNVNNNINININNNNNNINHVPQKPTMAQVLAKPRFDRTLKPSFNSEAINAIRAQINFGRSPEASGKAITGLQNLGNTCFMNSVIQCLAYVPSLVMYFHSDSYYHHINLSTQYGTNGELAIEFGALVEKLNSHRYRYIEPKSFRDAVTKHIGFAGNEQQDSHEFMMMLFDKLHHDLNIHGKDKSKQQNGLTANDDSNINTPRATLGYQFWKRHLEMNKSVISDSFEGIFMSTLTCSYCKGQSNTFEVFNCLSLPIPSESRCHVRDCLSHFSNPERIEAAWECPRCKLKREADKKIVICKLPRILIIHLKRFSLDGRWRQKLQTTVDFPLYNLTVDCTNVLPQSAYGPVGFKSTYNLCAVVNHYGHLDGGHYTAFCKMENQRWFTFDDSTVTEMKDADVCGQSAYILFYTATSP